MSSKLLRYGVKVTVIFVSLALIVSARLVFPLIGSDSVVFLPPALFLAQGYGFVNPLYLVSHFADPSHQDLFNYYVPLFPLVLGALAKSAPSIQTLFLICAGFGILHLILFGRQILKIGAGDRAITTILAICPIIYLGIYLVPTSGRPELLSSLWALLLYVTYNSKQTKGKMALMGALFGCMALTQLMGLYFSFLVFTIAELSNNTNIKTQTKNLTVAGLVAVAVFAVVIVLYPPGASSFYFGLSKHISYVMHRHDRGRFLYFYYWFYTPYAFGFVVVFLLAAGYFLKDIRVRWRAVSAAQRVIIMAAALLLVFGLFRFVLTASPTVYNVTQFLSPLLLYVFGKLAVSRNRRLIQLPLSLIFLYSCFIFIRIIVLGFDYTRDGRDFETVSRKVTYAINTYKPNLVSSGLWALCPDPKQRTILTKSNYKPDDIVLLQRGDLDVQSKVISGWELLYQCGAPTPHKVLGLPVRHPLSYTFSVYRVR